MGAPVELTIGFQSAYAWISPRPTKNHPLQRAVNSGEVAVALGVVVDGYDGCIDEGGSQSSAATSYFEEECDFFDFCFRDELLERLGIELGADLGALDAVGVEEVVDDDRVSGADAVGEAEEAVDLDGEEAIVLKFQPSSRCWCWIGGWVSVVAMVHGGMNIQRDISSG